MLNCLFRILLAIGYFKHFANYKYHLHKLSFALYFYNTVYIFLKDKRKLVLSYK